MCDFFSDVEHHEYFEGLVDWETVANRTSAPFLVETITTEKVMRGRPVFKRGNRLSTTDKKRLSGELDFFE